MIKWSKDLEEKLTFLIKDWLKHRGKTQADLKESLKASSSRMPNLIEVLKADFKKGGIATIAERLCSIESNWINPQQEINNNQEESDPFNQLDLLLEELRENINN
ncbi:hypothetical protein [Prochlorococcus sp. MIT 1223]|uniref:hypothetical protein n=1 Tax=Prochlorococcus sp. MIT 1223 TaxID=3096217 RepID=UPI002A74C5CE|nr:hypothetical protein [Prochlorococcus sp. MIT 1223]